MLNTCGRMDQMVVDSEIASTSKSSRTSSGPRVSLQTAYHAPMTSEAQKAVSSGKPPHEKSG